jgi:hypothetical protein
MEIALSSHDGRRRVGRPKDPRKSRLSNGSGASLPNVDGRSAAARRFRDIVSAILIDQGGFDECSESRLQLVRRFAACAVLAEQAEAKLANGEDINISEHSLLCSTMVRVASRLGLERRAKDISPTLDDILRDVQ